VETLHQKSPPEPGDSQLPDSDVAQLDHRAYSSKPTEAFPVL